MPPNSSKLKKCHLAIYVSLREIIFIRVLTYKSLYNVPLIKIINKNDLRGVLDVYGNIITYKISLASHQQFMRFMTSSK